MKKTFLLIGFFLGLFSASQAQTAKASPALVSQMKSGAKSNMADNNGAGNTFTTGITDLVKTPLNLDAAQQKSMSQALYDFFTEKAGFLNLRRTDQTAYQQQEDALVAKLTTKLGAFLTPDQVSKFLALKPAAGTKQNQLGLVFY